MRNSCHNLVSLHIGAVPAGSPNSKRQPKLKLTVSRDVGGLTPTLSASNTANTAMFVKRMKTQQNVVQYGTSRNGTNESTQYLTVQIYFIISCTASKHHCPTVDIGNINDPALLANPVYVYLKAPGYVGQSATRSSSAVESASVRTWASSLVMAWIKRE